MAPPPLSLRGAERQSVLLAVAQNRKAILWANTESVTDFPSESVVAHADSYMFLHVIARSEATWQYVLLAVAQNRKAILWANTESVTNLPKQQPPCQVSLRGRGLPHQCAHWFAMTCRNLPGVCGCKNVVHNDMLKTGTRLRMHGRGARGILYRPHPFSLCRFSKAARHQAALVSSISPMEAAQLEASECCPSFFPNL